MLAKENIEQLIQNKDHFKNVINSYVEKHPEMGFKNTINVDWLIYLKGPFEEIHSVGFATDLIPEGETYIPYVKIYIHSPWGKKIADEICKELSDLKVEYVFS